MTVFSNNFVGFGNILKEVENIFEDCKVILVITKRSNEKQE